LERFRQMVEQSLNTATDRAYAIVDRPAVVDRPERCA
jgi:hypothetical protein